MAMMAALSALLILAGLFIWIGHISDKNAAARPESKNYD